MKSHTKHYFVAFVMSMRWCGTSVPVPLCTCLHLLRVLSLQQPLPRQVPKMQRQHEGVAASLLRSRHLHLLNGSDIRALMSCSTPPRQVPLPCRAEGQRNCVLC